MSIFKRSAKDSSRTVGTLIGNEMAKNAQNATNASVQGMDLFRSAMVT